MATISSFWIKLRLCRLFLFRQNICSNSTVLRTRTSCHSCSISVLIPCRTGYKQTPGSMAQDCRWAPPLGEKGKPLVLMSSYLCICVLCICVRVSQLLREDNQSKSITQRLLLRVLPWGWGEELLSWFLGSRLHRWGTHQQRQTLYMMCLIINEINDKVGSLSLTMRIRPCSKRPAPCYAF